MRDVPEHYEGSVDVIGIIMNRRGVKAAVDFCFDNILKYATRMTRKGQLQSDLKKINVYSKRIIDMIRVIDEDYEDLLNELLETNDASVTVSYLEGHFGTEYVLDYIQGRLIDIALLQREESTGHRDLERALNTLTLSTCYSVMVTDLENREVDEDDDIDDDIDDIVDTLQDLGKIIIKEIFKS